ncbi:MAG TPA: phage tail tip lysozyme [Solirubrobacterales bacterium]|nr:phage tail tip lysozyme [Solirubrobacterales bacterium]
MARSSAKRRALEIVFGVDSTGVSAGMRRVSRETGKYNTQAKKQASTTRQVGSSMASAAKAAAGLAAAYLSISQGKQAIVTTQDLALTTMGLNRNLGLATKQASRWAVVSKARGVDSKALVMGFTTLSKRIEATKDGTESALKPFKELGITQKELASASGNYSKQIDMVAKALGNAEGSTKRQAAAQTLLGRGYATILPMFSKGAAGLKDQLRWADEFGATLDEKTIAKMDALTMAQRRSKVATMGLQIAFAKHATPAVTEAYNAYGDFVKLINSNDLTRDQKVAQIRKQYEKYSEVILDTITDLAPEIAQRAGETGVEIAKGIGRGFMDTGILGKAAIGVWLLKSFGGASAIVAAGKTFGKLYGGAAAKTAATEIAATSAVASMGGGAATGAATAGAAAGGVIGKLKTFGKLAGKAAPWAAAITASLDVVDAAFRDNTPEKNAMDEIDRLIEGRKKNLAWLEEATQDVSDFIGPDDAQKTSVDIAEDAQKFKDVLEEIRKTSGAQALTLRSQGIEYLKNLDISVQQEKVLRRILNATANASAHGGKPQLRIDQFSELIRGGEFVGGDLQKATDKQLAMVSRSYNKFTPQWRNAVWQTLKAQESAVRRNWTRNGKLTKEGLQRIKQIQERRKNMLAGADPIGIAKGIVNGWKKAKNANQINMGQMVRQLRDLPPKARQSAAKTMLDYARELENKQKLPEGTVKRLRSKILLSLGPKMWKSMKSDATGGMDGVADAFKRGSDKSDKAMGKLSDSARKHARNVKAAVRGINSPVRTAYEGLASDANVAAGAFGAKSQVKLAFRRGGPVPLGKGKLVPVRVSPGERVDYQGRSWTVPGRPEKKDSVYAELPQGAAVMTWDGQARMAKGESRAKAIRNQLPHFSTGGKVGAPKLRGGNPHATSVGQASIDTMRKAALKWVEEHSATNTGAIRNYKGVPMADWVAGALEYAAKKGASPQPTSGYRSHAYNVSQGRFYFSEHEETKYPGGAVDFGGYTTGLSAKMSVVNATRDYKYPLLAPIGFRDDGHASGTGHRKGGLIRGYQFGGRVRAMTDALIRRGYSPKAAAGIIGNAYREAGPDLNPYSVGTGGGGLFGFTTSPISLADLKADAARRGVDWGDIDFQIGFMDRHMPADLKARLNASSVAEATSLFMAEWERPGIPAEDDRQRGAAIAWGLMRERQKAKIKGTKANLRQTKKLWRRIKTGPNSKIPGAGPNAKRLAKKSSRAIRRAMKAARNFDFEGATEGNIKGRKARRKSHELTTRRRNAVRDRRKDRNNKPDRPTAPGHHPPAVPPSPGGWDPSKPFSATNAPGRGYLSDETRNMLGLYGTGWQADRNTLDTGLTVAQTTARKDDDAAYFRAILEMERARKNDNKKKLLDSTRKLKRLGGAKRLDEIREELKDPNARKARLEKRLEEIDKELGKSKISKERRAALRAERGRVRGKLGLAKDDIRELNQERKRIKDTISVQDTALDNVNSATSEVSSAEQGLADLNEDTGSDSSASDILAELKAIRESNEKLLAEQKAMSAIGGAEFGRYVKDWLSGEIVGKQNVGQSNPTMRY